MRCVFKILLLPLVVILSVMKLFLEGATKLYCLVAGIVINILVICSVLAIITQQWFALVVFVILCSFIWLALLSSGFIAGLLENIKDKLLSV